MLLERVLALSTTFALVGSFVFSLVAVRGYWHTPFGDVLRPLPIAYGGFVVAALPEVLGLEVPVSYRVIVASGAVLAAFVAAAEGVVLLAGWRRV